MSSEAVRIIPVGGVGEIGKNATLVEYSSNSAADEVTGKKIRLENEAILFTAPTRPGMSKERSNATSSVLLILWAPAGSDNADQWNSIAHSFHWSR